jgi:hypothetical protein
VPWALDSLDMLAPCLGGLSFQPTKSDAVECDRLCNRLTTISFKKRSCEPLRDLPSSFYSGGRPVSPRLSVIHWAPPCIAVFMRTFPKLISSRSVMPCVCIVSSPLVPLFSWDAPPRTETHASIPLPCIPHTAQRPPRPSAAIVRPLLRAVSQADRSPIGDTLFPLCLRACLPPHPDNATAALTVLTSLH